MYPVKENEVAYIRISSEPVFVLKIDGIVATVRRMIQFKDEGNQYIEAAFRLSELASEKQMIVNEINTTMFHGKLRKQASKDFDAAEQPQFATIPDATGYSN